jgi:membrane-bound lytic murein transglycosylase MltF
MLPTTVRQQAQLPVVGPRTNSSQWTGDLDALVERRVVRIAVPYSKTQYYVVKGAQQGAAYESGKAFEGYLNRKHSPKNRHIQVHVVFLPTSRGGLLSDLTEGFADIVVAGLTITPEREKLVDFCEPAVTGVNEIAVTGPRSPKLVSIEDLGGQDVFLRKSSSYWQHVELLNERLRSEAKPVVQLQAVPEELEDEDLLEMVNAGLLSTIVVDDYEAELWSKLLPRLQLHPGIVVNKGGAFAWAVRKHSPLLMAAADDFLKAHRQGTLFGQQMINKYSRSTDRLRQAVSPVGIERFERSAEIFRKYSSQYGMDYLLMMAKGYQESRLNQAVRSPAGAIGIMQLMPATGRAMKVGDIRQEEANIHAGVKYFHATMQRLYGSEHMDDLNKVLFTLAAYNCGPARVRRLREEAAQDGLDANSWFHNVEIIAAARVGGETVRHVSNVYKYYVAYKLIAVREEERRKARESLQKPS